MSQEYKDFINNFWQKISQSESKYIKDKAATEAAEQSRWDALPEEEKRRITLEREQEERERKEYRARQERKDLEDEWNRHGVTPRFYEATWENWRADTPEQKKALETIRQAWDKNLFVIGGNGTGKTHLAMCLAKDGATYCLLPELFREVRENMDKEQAIIDRYGESRLLILDEVGRQKGSDFERNLLFEIIDKRWNNFLPTTIIGNIGQKEFADLCGMAILDRLRPVVIKFDWESKR